MDFPLGFLQILFLVCMSFLGLQTNDHKLCSAKQQKCIVSQLWRSVVQNQGVGRAALPLEVLGRILPYLFQLLWAVGIL